MTVHEAVALVIEDLVDSDFRPGHHEAYAYITDRYSQLSHGRLGSSFLRIINEIDWDYVEMEVERLKAEAGQRNPDSVLDDIEFHANQIELAMKTMTMGDVGGLFGGAAQAGLVMEESTKNIHKSVAFFRENRATMAANKE